MEYPSPTISPSLEALVAQAVGKSRECATCLLEIILPLTSLEKQEGAQRVLALIHRKDFFSTAMRVDLKDLIEDLSIRIMDGTTEVESFVSDPCHVTGPASWTKEARTGVANDLSLARAVLVDFQEAVMMFDVHLKARRMIDCFSRKS
jgi:hypothetical protein